MLVLRLVATLLFFLLLAGQLPFLSGEAYAQGTKATKGKKATTHPPKQCCTPGAICPTPHTNKSPGCKCCGFRVDGKLDKYKGLNNPSTMDVAGTTVTFIVRDQTVDGKMKAIGDGNNGTFTLRIKDYSNGDSPTGKGKRLECEDVGNTSIPDRAKEYLQGAAVSEAIFEVAEILLNAVPKYEPDLDEDRNKQK
jgi:hypothetical protein